MENENIIKSAKKSSNNKLKPITKRYEESVKQAFVKIIGVAERKREKGFSDAEINIMRLRDRENIRCIPRNIEYPGRNLEFYFKKYKGDALEYYNLKDGEEVMLPRGVAHRLIESGAVETFIYSRDQFTGKKISKRKEIRRFTADGSSLLDDIRSTKIERGF